MSDTAITISPPVETADALGAPSLVVAPSDLVDSTQPLLEADPAAPVPDSLRDLARPGPEYDPQALEEAVASRKVIVVGNQGIPAGTLVAVGLSFLLNALFVSLLMLAYFNSPWLPNQLHLTEFQRAHGDDSDGGGAGHEHTLMILGAEGPLTGADPAPNLGAISAGTMVPPPTGLPAPPDISPTHSIAALLSGAGPASIDVPLIGVPVDTGQGVPRLPPPAFIKATQTMPAVGPTIVGPAVATVTNPATPSAAPASGTSSSRKEGKVVPGYNPSDPDDDGPVYQMMRGKGNGSGDGDGNGLNRGPSGANNEQPGIISLPQPNIGWATSVRMTKFKVVAEITVLADGTPGDIKIIQSSGDADIDSACLNAFKTGKYRAAYRNGRSFTAKMQAAFSNGIGE